MDATVKERPTKTGLAWVFPPWLLPLWYAAVAYGWWRAVAVELPATMRAGTGAATVAIAGTVAGKFGAFLIEAGFYHLLWRGRGRRLPFWRFFCVVASASTADLLARLLQAVARRDPGLEPWLAPVAGLEIARGTAFHTVPALRASFGTLGLLAALRLLLTAHGQRQALGLGLGRAVAWTTAVWLATRVATLFAVDLMSGRSPLPHG